jgi:hypothetical protein
MFLLLNKKRFFFIEERTLMAKYSIFCIAFLVSISFSEEYYHRGSESNQISITPAEPTHYFYTPMAKVNPPYRLVVSLHEISFSLPENLQLQASLFDNIGRINFGAKYGIQDNLSVGAGIASSLVHIGNGGHAIRPGDQARFGAFLCYEFIKTHTFEAVLVPQTQLFVHNSIGIDLGGMATPSDIWSVIWEVGTSFDLSDNPTGFWFNTDGGIRIHPPSIPFLSFDGGVDVQEFQVNVKDAHTSPSIYFDVIFGMVTK